MYMCTCICVCIYIYIAIVLLLYLYCKWCSVLVVDLHVGALGVCLLLITITTNPPFQLPPTTQPYELIHVSFTHACPPIACHDFLAQPHHGALAPILHGHHSCADTAAAAAARINTI